MICAKTQSAPGFGVGVGVGVGDGLVVSDGLGLELDGLGLDGLGLGLDELELDGLALGLDELELDGLRLGLELDRLELDGLGLELNRTARTAAAAPPPHGECADPAGEASAGAIAMPDSKNTPPTTTDAARTACTTGVRFTALRWSTQLKLIRLSLAFTLSTRRAGTPKSRHPGHNDHRGSSCPACV